MSECYQIAEFWIKAGGVLATGTGAIIAAVAFLQGKKLDRSKWLGQLHEKFFEKDTHKDIRLILDYKHPVADYENLSRAFVDSGNFAFSELQEKLVNYLNFFEFIATLEKRGQLTVEEVNMTFGYYIKNLGEHKWIIDSLDKYEFKNQRLLSEKIRSLSK